MSIFIDILLLFVICFCLIKHLRLGLFCSILSLLKFILAFVVALFLGGYSGKLLADLFPTVGGGRLFAVICYVLVFVVAYVVVSLIIKGLSKLKVPVLTKVDKLLGALLGLILGLLLSSMISGIVYTILEIYSTLSGNAEALFIYSDSYIFKIIYDLKIFGFIGSLF